MKTKDENQNSGQNKRELNSPELSFIESLDLPNDSKEVVKENWSKKDKAKIKKPIKGHVIWSIYINPIVWAIIIILIIKYFSNNYSSTDDNIIYQIIIVSEFLELIAIWAMNIIALLYLIAASLNIFALKSGDASKIIFSYQTLSIFIRGKMSRKIYGYTLSSIMIIILYLAGYSSFAILHLITMLLVHYEIEVAKKEVPKFLSKLKNKNLQL